MEAANFPASERGFGLIPCCECSTTIQPNQRNLCRTCLSAATNLAKSVPKQVPLHRCSSCQRILTRSQAWVIANPESRELLAVCLKQLKGLTELKLVDAAFNSAEPDSKTIQVKLTARLETVEEVLTVDFDILDSVCPQCDNNKDKDQWNCVVQVWWQ